MIDHKTAVEYALHVFQKEMKRQPEPTNEQDAATIGILALGIREALSGNLITDYELGSVHDVIFEVTDNEYSNDDLRKIWQLTTEDIKAEGLRWGIDDTAVRDNLYEWAQKNVELFKNFVPLVKEVETEHEES
jgi:hypothetical protein